jgi:hypothetical protein
LAACPTSVAARLNSCVRDAAFYPHKEDSIISTQKISFSLFIIHVPPETQWLHQGLLKTTVVSIEWPLNDEQRLF